MRTELLGKIMRVVNVDDFGGDPTGQKIVRKHSKMPSVMEM